MGYRFCMTCGERLAATVEPSDKTCPKCGSQSPPDYRFCGSCGAKLNASCPNCGADVPPDSRYCPNCAFLCGEGRYEPDLGRLS
jgi:predicted amidophosphoribosyltransferase